MIRISPSFPASSCAGVSAYDTPAYHDISVIKNSRLPFRDSPLRLVKFHLHSIRSCLRYDSPLLRLAVAYFHFQAHSAADPAAGDEIQISYPELSREKIFIISDDYRIILRIDAADVSRLFQSQSQSFLWPTV